MSEAVRVGDLTNHSMPIKGSGSPDVFIGGQKAWRALPAGVGDGLDQASKSVKQIMDKPPFTPPEVMPELPTLSAQMVKVAGQAEAAGAIGATMTVTTSFGAFSTQATILASTYIAGAAVPGGEPAARTAFTLGFQAGLAQAMTTSVQAIAGSWDMDTCQQPGPAGPHGPGVVIKGCQTVFINNLPAVVKGQEVIESVGGPSKIQIGCGTVFIGDKAPESSDGRGGVGNNANSATKGLTPEAKTKEHGEEVKGKQKGPNQPEKTNKTPIKSNKHKAGHLCINSQTICLYPENRARTIIGVGEMVALFTSGRTGQITWSIVGKSTLSAETAPEVVLTAHDRDETATVTATDECGCEASITFRVLEPTGVHMVQLPNSNVLHVQGLPSIGFASIVYITPNIVSFEGVEFSEGDCISTATGYFAGKKHDGIAHAGRGAGKWTRAEKYVDGKGTQLIGVDEIGIELRGQCYQKPYSWGTFDWYIPWLFRLNNGPSRQFAKVHQSFTIDSNGDMSASKGEVKLLARLNDPIQTSLMKK